MEIDDLEQFVGPEALRVFRTARDRMDDLSKRSAEHFEESLRVLGINPADVCIAVLGSSGRTEALGASDFDLVPIARDDETLTILEAHNDELRQGLSRALDGLDIARGRDLLKCVSLPHLVDAACIGGDKDDRTTLTQRVLLLTESRQVGGGFPLRDVRRDILGAYAQHRSAGRHPMAYCNDVARYYRTVCIDYKSRVDTKDTDWCTRNVKLRHSRKVWYFASLISVCAITGTIRPDNPRFVEALLETMELPPVVRMFSALELAARPAGGRVLDHYAWFLDFMADEERRKQLGAVPHDKRYVPAVNNPYPALQWNSRTMHAEMIAVLESVNPELRRRVLDWFLL